MVFFFRFEMIRMYCIGVREQQKRQINRFTDRPTDGRVAASLIETRSSTYIFSMSFHLGHGIPRPRLALLVNIMCHRTSCRTNASWIRRATYSCVLPAAFGVRTCKSP